MNLRRASELLEGDASFLQPQLLETEIQAFSIDSRTVEPGDLFFALSQKDYVRAGFNGSFADGHQFIRGALEAGALAAVARRDHFSEDSELYDLRDRLIMVEDVIAGLQTLARRVYEAWGKPVIAITGSAGKTTTKDLTAHILRSTGLRVLKSARNYNNGLGLPLAVLHMVSGGRTPEEFDLAVLEMGMSSPTHEIQRLVAITPPDVGVELLVAPVHLEFLGTIENIAAAKAELIEGLKPGGIAILNADDPFVMAMRVKHDGPVLTFGIENAADVAAEKIDVSRFGQTSFQLRTTLGTARAVLPLAGRHNLVNALAASAVATSLGIGAKEIAESLRSVEPPKMRGEIIHFAAGFTVVDDSYNSNPRSLLSMVNTISESGRSASRRIVIAGEMLELGPESARMHRETGSEIAGMGIDILWGVRGFGMDIVEGAREAGMPGEMTRFFENSDQAAEALSAEVTEGDLVLVKGSRGVSTDRVVALLKERFTELEDNRTQ